MQVTLSDNKLYRLSFRHEYQHVFATVEYDYMHDEDTGKIIGRVAIQELITKYPIHTHAYLCEINPADGKRINEEPDYEGCATLNPVDIPNKEIARKTALSRLIDELPNGADAKAVFECYRDRRITQPVVKPTSNVTVQ